MFIIFPQLTPQKVTFFRPFVNRNQAGQRRPPKVRFPRAALEKGNKSYPHGVPRRYAPATISCIMEKMKPENKKKLIALIVLAAVAVGGSFAFVSWKKQWDKKKAEEARRLELQKQKEELRILRAGSKPLTEEELKKQKTELEKLRKEAKTPTKEEIEKQKKELEKLRSQQ